MSFTRKRWCTRILRIFVVLTICYFCYHALFKCNWTPFPEQLARNQTWQPVNQARTAYVFSAYLDDERHVVIIIGAMTKDRVPYICQLWTFGEDGVSLKKDISYPRAHIPPEHHDKRYAMTLFECPYRSAKYPAYVSLISNSCETPLNLIHIEETKVSRDYKMTFTVCLSPLNFHYRRAYELVEWIELNRILGAEKFIIYNHSSASNVKDVLEYYSKQGYVEVIQWQLPIPVDIFPVSKTQAEIHYFGQVAALNDCLYRSKRHSEFIVNIDLDEIIVPHSNTSVNWQTMINEIAIENAKVFVFKNTHFRKDWRNYEYSENKFRTNIIQKAKQFKLTTLQTYRRERNIDIKGVRSKYIVRTNGIHYLMVHFVLDLPSAVDVTVSEDIGLLHHYKNFGHYIEQNNSKTDYTVLDKYGEVLIQNVERVWNELSDVNMVV
ncbi:uncharacterized protein LOC132736735 [Ruditapes philippinarum]|uniref:uncharacterized protein LOC132736735 n=1 Tax=Ruditapes philippinarum TaxID=129788 RepID=UPI00295BC232|nr:uncharacterized protein LOC132736735 [Ruditapes philippinarum]